MLLSASVAQAKVARAMPAIYYKEPDILHVAILFDVAR